jgi:glucokinase
MNSTIILTLEAVRANFNFSAIQNGSRTGDILSLPAHADNLDKCLDTLKKGFRHLMDVSNENLAAISFAFPGPADYKNGVIGDLPNLPAFRGGIPLGPILEEEFQIPVFINNEGNLFAYGESKAGLLPWVNHKLQEQGNPKRYNNLIGITVGTGFETGIVVNEMLLEGDNNAASETWKMRNKRHPYSFVEETLSIHALKRMYAEQIAMDPAKAPEPFEMYRIAKGEAEGIQQAAREAFLRYGEVLGDAIATLVNIIDGLVVVGGGIAGAYPLFSGAMLDQFNSSYDLLNGKRTSRLVQKMYDLERDWSLKQFLQDDMREIELPSGTKKIRFEESKKLAVGLSRLGTSEAITLGAYYSAISKL